LTATPGWCRPKPAALLAALLALLIAGGPARAVRGLFAIGPVAPQGPPTPDEAEEGASEESKALVARRRVVADRPAPHATLAPARRVPHGPSRPPAPDAHSAPCGQGFPLRC